MPLRRKEFSSAGAFDEAVNAYCLAAEQRSHCADAFSAARCYEEAGKLRADRQKRPADACELYEKAVHNYHITQKPDNAARLLLKKLRCLEDRKEYKLYKKQEKMRNISLNWNNRTPKLHERIEKYWNPEVGDKKSKSGDGGEAASSGH